MARRQSVASRVGGCGAVGDAVTCGHPPDLERASSPRCHRWQRLWRGVSEVERAHAAAATPAGLGREACTRGGSGARAVRQQRRSEGLPPHQPAQPCPSPAPSAPCTAAAAAPAARQPADDLQLVGARGAARALAQRGRRAILGRPAGRGVVEVVRHSAAQLQGSGEGGVGRVPGRAAVRRIERGLMRAHGARRQVQQVLSGAAMANAALQPPCSPWCPAHRVAQRLADLEERAQLVMRQQADDLELQAQGGQSGAARKVSECQEAPAHSRHSTGTQPASAAARPPSPAHPLAGSAGPPHPAAGKAPRAPAGSCAAAGAACAAQR